MGFEFLRSSVMRTGLTVICAVALPAIAMSGCGDSDAASDNGTVVIDWYPGALGAGFDSAFARGYQAADVKTVQQFDNPRFTNMQANRGNPRIDVGVFTAPPMPLVSESGLIEPLDSGAVPNLGDVDPETRIEGDPYVPIGYGSWGILYDAEKVRGPLNSWSDLLRSDLEGHVTAPNVTYNSSLLTLDALARLQGGSLEKPDAGYAAMRQIRESGPGLWDMESVAIGWLKTGEVWATPFFSGNSLNLIKEATANGLEFVVPQEGGYFVPFYAAQVADAPNPAGASEFINHMLSIEAQERFADSVNARPVNTKANVSAAVKDATPFADKLIDLDWRYFAENRDEIVGQWNDRVNE